MIISLIFMYPCDWFEFEWKKEAQTWFPQCRHMWAVITDDYLDHNADDDYGGDHNDYHFLDVGLDNDIDHDNLHGDDDDDDDNID